MDGIISINKEMGYTSNDVIAILRGILRMKKIGHTGTLDPDATGVLPVCLGKATKAAELLTAAEKEYEAQLIFGQETDTQDLSGSRIFAGGTGADRRDLAGAADVFGAQGRRCPVV